MAYTFTEYVDGAILEAADLNNSFQEVSDALDNLENIGDASGDLADFRTTKDTGGVGSEVLPVDLLEEIQELRHEILILKQAMNPVGIDYWYQAPYSRGAVNLLEFGADPTGVADSTAALQAAVDSGYGILEIPAGDYLITSTITITQAIKIVGLGPGPAGLITGPDLRYNGVALNHHFNGTFFDILGINNNIGGSVGTTFENLILRQTYGNGSAHAGKCLRITGTSSNYRPTWVKVYNVNIEAATGTHDDWEYGVFIDGSTITTGGIGLRDFMCSHMRIVTGGYTVAGMALYTATNIQVTNIFCDGTNAHMIVSGVSGNEGQLGRFTAVSFRGELTLDYASGNQFWGCSFQDLTMTDNSLGNEFWGSVSHEPVMGGVSNTCYSNAYIYKGGTRPSAFKQLDGDPTHVAIDAAAGVFGSLDFYDDGTNTWYLGKAADNSFFISHEDFGNALAISDDNDHPVIYIPGATTTTGPTYHITGAAQTITLDCSWSNMFQLDIETNDNFTVTMENPQTNQFPLVWMRNRIGGSGTIGTITWDASVFRFAGGTAPTKPADGYERFIQFRSDGTHLYEMFRLSGDISYS